MTETTDQITIVEGPPPDFQLSEQEWVLSVLDSPRPFAVAYCQLRAFDAAALVARCQRAWQRHDAIHLDHPTPLGLRTQTEIIAARADRVVDGDVLYLWVRVPIAE